MGISRATPFVGSSTACGRTAIMRPVGVSAPAEVATSANATMTIWHRVDEGGRLQSSSLCVPVAAGISAPLNDGRTLRCRSSRSETSVVHTNTGKVLHRWCWVTCLTKRRALAVLVALSVMGDLAACGPAASTGRSAPSTTTIVAATTTTVTATARTTVGTTPTTTGPPTGLAVRVADNQLVDASGQPLVLHGVDRSGTEYACIQGWSIFDGPSDAASVQAIASWHVNVVRVPLNEDCWLGINGVQAAYAGANYIDAIRSYVALLNSKGIYAELSLIWGAPGSYKATYNLLRITENVGGRSSKM